MAGEGSEVANWPLGAGEVREVADGPLGAGEVREVADGPLSLRVGSGGQGFVISLRGVLDLTNAPTLERQLDEALGHDHGAPVVVNLRELRFIDSTGVSLLFAAIERDAGCTRLRFIASESRQVLRLLEMAGVTRLMAAA